MKCNKLHLCGSEPRISGRGKSRTAVANTIVRSRYSLVGLFSISLIVLHGWPETGFDGRKSSAVVSRLGQKPGFFVGSA